MEIFVIFVPNIEVSKIIILNTINSGSYVTFFLAPAAACYHEEGQERDQKSSTSSGGGLEINSAWFCLINVKFVLCLFVVPVHYKFDEMDFVSRKFCFTTFSTIFQSLLTIVQHPRTSNIQFNFLISYFFTKQSIEIQNLWFI